MAASDQTPAPTATRGLTSVLAVSLAGGAVNLAVSLVDRPRAFADVVNLGAPLAAGVALFGIAALLFVAIGRALPLRAGTLGAWDLGISGALLTVAVFGPLVAALQRDVSAPRQPALAALLIGLVLGVTCAAYFAAARKTEHGGLSGALVLAVPLVAFEALTISWVLHYPLAGASTAVRAGLWMVLLGVGIGTWLLCRPCPRMPVLLGLVALVAVSPLVGLAGTSTSSAGASAATVDGPQRVCLITVDTLRPDMIASGESAAETPAIEALFADSVVFTNARSAAPWTKPAMATILTGVSPSVHGTLARRSRIPSELETLAESMRGAGYRTVGLGLNVHLERLFGFGQGFDEYFFPARGDYGTSYGARVLQTLWPHRYPELFPSTEAITDVALDWIDANRDEPFFLWIHLLDPHWPYEPPAEYVRGERTPRIDDFWGDHETVTNVQAGNTKLGPADRERVRELYKGEIRYADANLARIVERLKQLELYDDSLIVFASDHGEEFWEHGTFEHGHTMYDEVLRVPLAFKLPAASGHAGATVDAPVSTTALTPTMLELVGIATDPSRFDSASLSPWWTDGADPASQPVHASATYYHGEKRSVVFDDRKLVLDVETGRVELYDLAKDPAELHSLTDSRPDDVERGLMLLREAQESAEALRDRLGIEGDTAADLDDLDRARMQALGYAGDEG